MPPDDRIRELNELLAAEGGDAVRPLEPNPGLVPAAPTGPTEAGDRIAELDQILFAEMPKPAEGMEAQQAPDDPLAGTVAGAIGSAVQKVPVLQRALGTLQSGIQTVPNLISAGTNLLQGDFRTAGDRFISAGRSAADFSLNFFGAPLEAAAHAASLVGLGDGNIIPDIVKPEDLRTGSDLLEEVGVPAGPMVNTGVIAGNVTTRGIAGFGLDLFLDPFKLGKVGQLTKTGLAARKAGTLAKAPTDITGRIGSAAGAQARAGQRALIQVRRPFGTETRTLVRGAPVLAAFENGARALANLPGVNKIVQFRGLRAVKRAADKARTRATERSFERAERIAAIWREAEEVAEAAGIPIEEAAERVIQGMEVGGRRATQEALRADLGGAADALRGRVQAAEARVQTVLDEGNAAASKLDSRADALLNKMRSEIEELRLAEDRARNGISAHELQIEADAAPKDPRTGRSNVRIPPGGQRPNPRRANALRNARKRREAQLQPEIDKLRQQAEKARKSAQARADSVAARAGLGRLQSRLRQAEGAVEAVPTLPRVRTADPATRGQIKRLMDRYVEQGFSRAEALRAARAATMLGVDETMAPFAARMMGEFRDLIADEKALGLTIANVTDPALNYVTRVLTDEARVALINSGKMRAFAGRFREWFGKHGSTARRKAIYEGKTIPEINRWLRENLEGFTGKLFETDPALIAVRRAARLGRASRSSDFFRAMAEDYGRAVPDELIGNGWVRMDELLDEAGLRTSRPAFLGGESVPTALRGLDDLAVPAEIAEALRQYIGKTRGDPGLFLRFMDAANTIFKTGVTRLFPAFHFRNFTSDLWANYLGDVSIAGYRMAGDIMSDLRRGGTRTFDVLIDGETKTLTSTQIMDMLERHRLVRGQLGDTFDARRAGATLEGAGRAERFVAAAERAADRFARGSEAAVRGTLGRLPVARRVFVEGETFHRLAHVMDKLQKGEPLTDAVLSAKRYLIDYTDLTPFEKAYMRRLVPFWTFASRNLPLQIESLLTKPGKASKLAIYQQFIQRDENGGLNSSFVPSWVQRRIFGFNPEPDGSINTLSGIGIGFEDLALLDAPFEEFRAMFRPEIKNAAEIAFDQDFFTGRRLAQADRAPPALQFLEFAPGGNVFLRWLGYQPEPGPDGKPIGFRADRIKMNLLGMIPGVGGLSRVVSQASRIQDQVSGRRPESNEALRFATGLRADSFSREEAMVNNMRNSMLAAIEELEKLKRAGFTPDPGRMPRAFVQDPRAIRARQLDAEIRKTRQGLALFNKAALKRLRGRTQATGSLRSGR